MDIPEGPGKDRLQSLMAKGKMPAPDQFWGPWLAGGAVRRLVEGKDIDDGDIDLFVAAGVDPEKYIKRMDKIAEEKFVTNRAVTYRVKHDEGIQKIQIITKCKYGVLLDLLMEFDYTVCQFATDGQKIYYVGTALDDLRSNTLRKSPWAQPRDHAFIKRFIKYTEYGFIPEPGLMPEIMKKVADTRTDGLQSSEDSAFYDPDDTDDKKWVKLRSKSSQVVEAASMAIEKICASVSIF